MEMYYFCVFSALIINNINSNDHPLFVTFHCLFRIDKVFLNKLATLKNSNLT